MAMKNFDELKNLLKNPRVAVLVPKDPIPIHPLQPKDYLNFSEKDLKSTDTRSLVNSIGNIKRALECRSDELLHAWGYITITERQKFELAEKLQLLSRIGVISPLVLKRIDVYRGDIETNYKEPSKDDVMDYYSVVSLFIKYTDRILHIGEVQILNELQPEDSVLISVDEGNKTIRITYVFFDISKPESKPLSGIYKLRLTNTNFEEYTTILKWWLKLLEN
jgi:hypothetical protein